MQRVSGAATKGTGLRYILGVFRASKVTGVPSGQTDTQRLPVLNGRSLTFETKTLKDGTVQKKPCSCPQKEPLQGLRTE